MGLVLNGNMVTKTKEKAKVMTGFLASVFEKQVRENVNKVDV